MQLFHDTLETPIGELTIKADSSAVRTILFDQPIASRNPNEVTRKCRQQLEEYFRGERTGFDLPLIFQGTEFQQQVWRALLHVPFARTASYGEQARRIERPKAVRAVGAANGQNKHTIVIPCHRVIGANGSLTGYGGGIERKKWLLEHERRVEEKSLARKC